MIDIEMELMQSEGPSRSIRERTRLPSRTNAARGGRPDPLAGIVDAEVVPMLEAAPGLRAVAIFTEMLRRQAAIQKTDLEPFPFLRHRKRLQVVWCDAFSTANRSPLRLKTL